MPQLLKFEFRHHDLSLKHNTYRRVLGKKTVDFACCIKVRIVQSFREQNSDQ